MPGKRYTRSYVKDQDGDLVAKARSTGGRRKPYRPPGRRQGGLPVLGLLLPQPTFMLAQRPPGSVARRCATHREAINKACPACQQDLAAEAQAVQAFDRVAGITHLPQGAGTGKYTKDRPLEKIESTYTITLNRVKDAKDGSPRLMANDTWRCPVCGVLLLTTKRCPICDQPKGRKPTQAAQRRWHKLMKVCSVCGFNHVPPAPTNCVRCRRVLASPVKNGEKKAWAEKLAQTKAQAKAKAETKLAAHAAEYKEANEMAKNGDTSKGTKSGFLGRDKEWWQAKPPRLCFYLVLTNDKAKLTDEEILAKVEKAHPGNRSIYQVGHVGWCRAVALNQYPSNPRPKYIPAGTSVPPRYYLVGKKRTTVKPEKAEKAPKTGDKAKKEKAKGKGKGKVKKGDTGKDSKPKKKKAAAKKKAPAKKAPARGKKVKK